MRREDEIIVSSISPPPEFQDFSPQNNNPCSSNRVVVIQAKGSLSPSPTQSTSLTTLPPPKPFRDFTPTIDENFIYTFIKERDVLCTFADKISFNILNEAMIIATIIPEAGSSDAQRRLSISTAAVGSGQRESHYFGSSLAPSSPNLQSGPLGGHESIQSTSKMLNTEPSCQSCKLRENDRNAIPKTSASSESCADTKETPPIDLKSPLFRPGESVASSLVCDASYSLPVDNIPNSTACTASFPLTTSSETGKNSDDNVSNHERTSALKLFKHGLTNPSNNINVQKVSVADVTKGKAVPGEIKSRNSASTKMRTQQTPADGSICLETNNNLTHEEGASDKTDKKPNRVQKAKSTKKKRRRTNSSTEADCQHQENQVPESMKERGQSGSTDLTIAIGTRSSGKPKRTIGDALLGLFRKPRSHNKGKSLLAGGSAAPEEETKPKHAETSPSVAMEAPLASRALPPTPCKYVDEEVLDQLHFHCEEIGDPSVHSSPLEPSDIAASIEKVKDCGWYWGPLSSEAAEDLLRGEPDGSFIVRDSSDSHYIFSLTFKLNGLVRHVRIEHDHGNFSFGPMTRFKASTIMDFVEKAIAHSRSGRYLFFLHRRPVLGPMRVQLIHPYSRFRHMRSLQHMCRFAILKQVRCDLINSLPLPNPLLEYLHAPHYYFEDKPT